MKGKNTTALQFEAEWEQIHADLDEVGLTKAPLEKFLAYIVKVGPPVSETIRMDGRPRKDGAGGYTTRLPESWEECHEVLREIEGVKAGSKAFMAARAAGQGLVAGGQGNYDRQGAFGYDQPKGKGKSKSKGKDSGKGKPQGDGTRGPCYEFRDKGTCKFGDTCRFNHDPQVTGRTPSGALTKAAKAAAKLAGTDPNQGPKPKPQPKPKAGNPDQSAAGKGKDAGGMDPEIQGSRYLGSGT